MLAEMTSTQVAEWMAFFQLEPWGAHEEDRRTATVAATVANTVPRKRGAKPYKPEQFMPKREPAKRQSVKDQMQMARAMAAMSRRMSQ